MGVQFHSNNLGMTQDFDTDSQSHLHCHFQEELLRCTACCEPFHPFCLSYDELPQSAEVEREWVCRRCAACQVCGRADGDGDKLRCGKCLKASHSDCLQPSQRETIPGQDGGDESWVSLTNVHLNKSFNKLWSSKSIGTFSRLT